jgi:hypothetical protein
MIKLTDFDEEKNDKYYPVQSEEAYLRHAYVDHGKKLYSDSRAVDGIAILETFLKNYQERVWYIPKVAGLKGLALELLEKLKNESK